MLNLANKSGNSFEWSDLPIAGGLNSNDNFETENYPADNSFERMISLVERR